MPRGGFRRHFIVFYTERERERQVILGYLVLKEFNLSFLHHFKEKGKQNNIKYKIITRSKVKSQGLGLSHFLWGFWDYSVPRHNL